MSKIKKYYISKWIILSVFLPIFIIFMAWHAGAQSKKPEESSFPKKQTMIKKFTPGEAFKFIQINSKNLDFVILDLRTPEEFESGHIEGAININYHSDTFVEDLDKLDKDKSYLVYCRTWRRSSDAVEIMTRQNFKELYRINGDIVKWKSEGLPVVKGKK